MTGGPFGKKAGKRPAFHPARGSGAQNAPASISLALLLS